MPSVALEGELVGENVIFHFVRRTNVRGGIRI